MQKFDFSTWVEAVYGIPEDELSKCDKQTRNEVKKEYRQYLASENESVFGNAESTI